MRVGQRRGTLYGLLIYRQGDRSRRLLRYGFDRKKVMLFPEAQKPARDDIHKVQVPVVIDVEVLQLTDVAVLGVEDALLAEFVVRRARMLVVRQPGEERTPFPWAVREFSPHRATTVRSGAIRPSVRPVYRSLRSGGRDPSPV